MFGGDERLKEQEEGQTGRNRLVSKRQGRVCWSGCAADRLSRDESVWMDELIIGTHEVVEGGCRRRSEVLAAVVPKSDGCGGGVDLRVVEPGDVAYTIEQGALILKVSPDGLESTIVT